MAIPNRALDGSIAAALESETAVTGAQRAAAWASVRARAAQQAALAPYAVPPLPRLTLLARLLLAVRRGLRLAMTDAVCYDRAAVRRESFQRSGGPPTLANSYLIHYYHPSALLRVGLF